MIQWGTGAVGTHALRFIVGNSKLELVGLKCFSDSKVGLTASEICGCSGSSVVATNDLDSVLSIDADCVLYMPRDPITDPTLPTDGSGWVPELLSILASGKNVVSPIQSAMHWRHLDRGNELRRAFQDACLKGGSSVVFTGIDPGFTSDCLVVYLSSLVGGVTEVRTWEAMDYSTYDVEATGNFLGFGAQNLDLDAVTGSIKVGWGGSLWLMADAFNVELDDIVVSIDTSPAVSDYESHSGIRIAAGTIGAVWWSLTGMVAKRPFLTVNHITRIGPAMAPSWPNVGKRGGYRVEITGSVPICCELPLGLSDSATTLDDATVMTASRCVSAVPFIVQAPTGYLTLNELPALTGWRNPVMSKTL